VRCRTPSTHGDEVALEILAGAGRELARLAIAMFERLGSVERVALAGGVVHLGDPLYEPFRAALPEEANPTRHVLEPVEAAARLALSASS
jgi:N-acetylglucosamine kinase-like BadF-type ATPase